MSKSIAQSKVAELADGDLVPAHELIQSQLGRRIAPSSLWRWYRKGVGGVKLRLTKIGGRIFCTRADFAAFVQQQNKRDGSPPTERSAEVERRLQEAGLIERKRPEGARPK
jgi:hypothetical protein